MGNLILVGMPACGKSTVGVVLAKTLNKGFVDTDLLLQQREHRTLQQIIDAEGIDYFHRAEAQVLLDVDGDDLVIATGGSAIYADRAMERFRRTGKIVYLEASLATVQRRLSDIRTRGVTLEKGQTIAELYDRRTPLYRRCADWTVETDGLTVEEVVEAIAHRQSRAM